MSFIQIIEMRTKNLDELQALSDQFFEATEGKRTVRRGIVTRDRNDPERYLRREADAPPRRPTTFYDLDVIQERT